MMNIIHFENYLLKISAQLEPDLKLSFQPLQYVENIIHFNTNFVKPCC